MNDPMRFHRGEYVSKSSGRTYTVIKQYRNSKSIAMIHVARMGAGSRRIAHTLTLERFEQGFIKS